MDSNRRTALMAGMLFITAVGSRFIAADVGCVLSVALQQPDRTSIIESRVAASTRRGMQSDTT